MTTVVDPVCNRLGDKEFTFEMFMVKQHPMGKKYNNLLDDNDPNLAKIILPGPQDIDELNKII